MRLLAPGMEAARVHARSDTIVPFADSEALAATGSSGLVTLRPVDDDHALTEFCARGELEAAVRELHAGR